MFLWARLWAATARPARPSTLWLITGLIPVALSAQSCSREARNGGTQATPGVAEDELRLRKLVIVDESGSERAILESSAEAGTRLVFRGKGNTVAATIGIEPGGPRVTLGKADGRPRAELGLGESGDTALILRDAKGRRRGGMIVSVDGEAGMALFDDSEDARCKLDLTRDGTAYLMLGDRSQMPRVVLSAAASGECAVALYGSAGPRIRLELDAAGKATVALLGSDAETTWSQTAP